MIAPRRHRSLGNRQALQVGVVAIGALMLSGLIEMAFSYREAVAQTEILQAAQATAAAREIDQYLESLANALSDTTKSPWGAAGFTPQRCQDDYERLMGLFPAISEVRLENDGGHELLFVSRTESNRLAKDGWARPPSTVQAARPLTARFGMPYFRNGSEPYVQVGFQDATVGRGKLVATLHLRLVAEVLKRLDVAGSAYLVDDQNRLIMHPVQTEMLKLRQLNDWPIVKAARSALANRARPTATLEGRDFDGREVVATATILARTGWLLVLEQPRAVVMEPGFATLRRATVLVILATLLASGVSAWSGRRMARPFVELRAASARIAGGDFDSPVTLDTGDELELLATDLNQMASRLRHFYEELEEQVAVRTQELLEARDVAERASQAKMRFLAAASHDLRQPMHSIGMLVTVLRHQMQSDEERHLTDKLMECVTTMEALFSSLLDISKLDAGAVRPCIEAFPVDDLLRRVCQSFEAQAANKGLELRIRQSHAIVRSDPGLLDRIVCNLVANAIRYTATGGVLVGCRRRGDQLAIQVFDTGPGIREEYLTAIFDEFFRLEASAPSDDKGLGLGLSIVQRSAQVLGHDVHVRSRIGRGSMFEVVVATAGEFTSGQIRGAAPFEDDGDDAVLAGAFLLVLDDDDNNRAALCALAEQWGCIAIATHSVAAARFELARHLRTPDLLITDYRLDSGGDGFDAIREIRQACAEALPAIIVTADIDRALLGRARKAGVPLLHKPLSSATLRQAAIRQLAAAACTASATRDPA